MELLIVAVLIILGTLFFALKGIFGNFPDNWQWVGIVLAASAIVMGTPSIFQRMLGRPRLLIEFDRIINKNERSLVIFLKNPPIKNKLWRKMGIRRDMVESLTASFRILETGTNRILLPICHARLYPDSDQTYIGSSRIALPPTYSVAASIMIAMWDNTKGKAIVPSDRLRQPLELSSGYYQLIIILMVDGEPRELSRRFNVGPKADDLIWVKPIPDKESS